MAANIENSDEKPTLTWICPPPRPFNKSENARASTLYSSISELRWGPKGPAGVAGIELQVALNLMQSELGVPPADNDFWPAKCQKLLVRPALEPIACAYWPRLATFDFDENFALLIASTLACRRLVYRTSPATGLGRLGDVAFEPIEVASQWLAKLKRCAEVAELRTALPAFAFAQVIMAHPFSDGNGRFARLTVHAGLARASGLALPAMALAPAFYRRGEALGRALTALSASQDWGPFYSLFLSTLDDSLTLTRVLQRARQEQ